MGLTSMACVGNVGPFDAAEMAEWFSAGYFAMDLLVKRPSDDAFLPLGDWIKRVGRLPFLLAGPAQPVKPAEVIIAFVNS
jgi:PERQ amino acid-rich with GYF domain-containing protein